VTTISIIIPVKRGGYVSAFNAIRQSGFDNDLYEVLLAEGCAPSRQRNMAAGAAAGDLLYFIDDDSCLNSMNLSICSNVMEDAQIAVVGGPSLTPATDSWLQQLFGAALTSLLGSGGVRNRYRAYGVPRETTDKELILCNLVVRRSVFVALGGFDERLYPNEENELLDRISSLGFKLIHDPQMGVFRSQRASLKAFVRQMFSYGLGRARQTLIAGSFSVVSFIPLFFVLYLVGMAFFSGHTFYLVPIFVYFFLVLISTTHQCFCSGRFSTVLLLLLYPLMHCVNGLGLLLGLVKGKPLQLHDDSITVRRVKEFGQDFQL